MKIEQLLNHLRYSELANLEVADTTNDANRLKMFSYINRGLAELNKEFSINQVEKIIKLEEGRSRYYIYDDKLVQILGAYYSDGTELSINNENDPDNSIFVPSLNTIEYFGANLATDSVEDNLSVIYLKGYADVTTATGSVSLSEGLLDALTNFVGYLAYSTVGVGNGTEATEFHNRYLHSVSRAHTLGFAIDNNSVIYRLTNRGFV